MAINYIDQLIHKTGLLITSVNWRRVLLCALMVADKLWEEDIVCNVDYITDNYPLLTVDDLNAMERKFLSLLDFKLLLKASVYAEYYFALRSISGVECFPSKALDKKTARLMDIKSISPPRRKRSYSVDTREKKENPVETSSLSFEQFSRFIAWKQQQQKQQKQQKPEKKSSVSSFCYLKKEYYKIPPLKGNNHVY